jgi:multicomponent Na+:H+ antiporter subunit B
MMELVINMVLLTLLAAITVGIIRVRNLFAVVVLAAAYSFLMATVMLVLDAVDVAMTEAAVGAGLSTIIALSALYLTKADEAPFRERLRLPTFVALGVGAMLIYGTIGLPDFGTADQPLHQHVGGAYLERNYAETHIPNVVTAVLASYRGFDTLGETTVIFTAGIGVLLLLKRIRRGRGTEG